MKNIIDIMNERNPKHQIRTGMPKDRKAYQHDYYMRVTKPKRQAAKIDGGSEC
ncbi:MAG: hypothetical protein LIP12_00130 [Clostridiales bacterium]|nr:hypothetical protein [Clostridiales bacterium]